ncbi:MULTISPECIES: hypothetical protein [Staphylococcus]|uniref:hypothetical protein n=1 Tax=Staphylococcus TaxID=1279 RepID=UPI0004454050|nr:MULTISPECIES: hypothetical protein [Staphylococcus]EVJ48890.1 hypothetical protein U042_02805 [Staphylococcus aureus UCIM6147]
MTLNNDSKTNEIGKMNLNLYDIHEQILSYLAAGKDIKQIDVVIEVNNQATDCLYIDQSEIQDNLLILRN